MSAPTTTRPDTTDTLSAVEGIRLVARRELVERLRDRAFLVSTLVTVVIIIGAVVIPQLVSGDPTSYDVAVTADGAEGVAERIEQTAASADLDITVSVDQTTDQAVDAVAAGELHAVVTADEIVVDEELPEALGPVLQQASRAARVAEGLVEAGVPAGEIPALLSAAPLPVRELDPPDRSGGEASGLAFFATFILYGQLIGYGFLVATGVVEEKSTRVVEVLLAALRPTHLLAGKVVVSAWWVSSSSSCSS